MTRSRAQRCCCDYCCKTCIESDILLSHRTRLHSSLKLRGLAGSFTAATLTGTLAGPPTISDAADLNDVEVPTGYMECGHPDLTCVRAAIYALVADLADSIVLGLGESNGNLCGAGIVQFSYASGDSILQLDAYPFSFTTDSGARYLGTAVTKTDGDPAFPTRPDLAKFDTIGLIGFQRMSESSRIVCDGIEQEIALAPYEEFYDAVQCNNLSGDFYQQCTGPTSAVVKLFL